MAFTLYDATIPSFKQTLGAMSGLIDKAEAFCNAGDFTPATLINTKLAEDMLPFGYQMKSVSVHSIKAIEGVRAGAFSPDRSAWPDNFDDMRAQLSDTRSALEAVAADEVNGFVGRDMAFVMGERRMEFTAEDFLMSFTMPNFYFHATAAYAVLRHMGIQIGKMDFMGRPRLKG